MKAIKSSVQSAKRDIHLAEGMRYASDMDESYRISPSTVPVGTLSQLAMP